MRVSEWLSKIMEKNELSAYGLTKITGIPTASIYRWLRSQRFPKHKFIQKISIALNEPIPTDLEELK